VIKLALKVVYYGVMLWRKGYTQGQFIYNVKLMPLTTGKTILYIVAKIILPYLIQYIEDYLIKHHSDVSDLVIRIYRVMTALLKGFELFNLLRFITHGDYPSMWNRLLGLKYVKVLLNT
jgi:hypothetical protein